MNKNAIRRRRRGSGGSLSGILFSASEPGFTFEPWDITTLYQDRAGTTPVTAAGQSVGLRLDKSQGLQIGPELVTNRDFAAGTTGWSLAAGWTVTGGGLSINQVGSTIGASQAFSVVAGRTYLFEFDVTAYTSGTLAFGTQTGATVEFGSVSSARHVRVFGIGGASNSGIRFYSTGAGFVGTIDNVSFKELAGNHQVAVSDAKRGVYGWMPKTGRRNLLNATDTLSTQSVTVTAVAHTLAFTGTGTVTLSGASTAGPLVGTGASNRVTLTFTPTAGSLTLTVSGSVTLAQLQLGSADTAYQRVVSQYDITEAGVPTCYYVQADGVDDAYVTPTITPNTDKVQVFAGVRKLSDSPAGHILGGNGNNSGHFETLSSGWMNTANRYGAGFATDAVMQIDSPASFTPPRSDVLSWRFDTAGATGADKVKLNVRGIPQTLSILGVPAQGNFGAFAHSIYSRSDGTLPFNGLDFGHAVRFGPNLDAATIARVESLIARNTPEVTL